MFIITITVLGSEPLKSDLRPLNIGPSYARKKAASREHWRSIVNILLLLFFDPGTQFPRNEKITLCNTKIIIIIIIILYYAICRQDTSTQTTQTQTAKIFVNHINNFV